MLCVIPVEIKRRIAGHLDQRDALNTTLASKQLEEFYPKSLQFLGYGLPPEDYFKFARAVVDHKVESIVAFVDPAHWNQLAPILRDVAFKKAEIYPSDYELIDRACWLPRAEDLRSGFIPPGSKIVPQGEYQRIEFVLEPESDPEPVPWLAKMPANAHFQEDDVTDVELDGTFTELTRIDPNVYTRLNIFRARVSASDLRHVALFKEFWLKQCVIEPCEPVSVDATFVYVHPSSLRYIRGVPRCVCLWLDLEYTWNDDGEDLWEFDASAFATTITDPIEFVEFFGDTTVSEATVEEYVRRMFPNAKSIEAVAKKY